MFLLVLSLLLPQPTLDFDYYKTNVEPIFVAKKAGFTRCVVCHSEGGRVGFLEELPAGAENWSDEQSRLNFEAVSRLVTPGDPSGSRLLMHPLEPDAGGRVSQWRAAVRFAGRPMVPGAGSLGAGTSRSVGRAKTGA